tara:strand:- start:2393 stop:2539 length:147 start_codon:yes stop_codon:yes gene_type:complete
MISPYKSNIIQRIIPPKIIIKGIRKIKKEKENIGKKLKRKCFKIKYFL